jgi:hypothetical protein
MPIPAIGITLSQGPNDSDGKGQKQAGKIHQRKLSRGSTWSNGLDLSFRVEQQPYGD